MKIEQIHKIYSGVSKEQNKKKGKKEQIAQIEYKQQDGIQIQLYLSY